MKTSCGKSTLSSSLWCWRMNFPLQMFVNLATLVRIGFNKLRRSLLNSSSNSTAVIRFHFLSRAPIPLTFQLLPTISPLIQTLLLLFLLLFLLFLKTNPFALLLILPLIHLHPLLLLLLLLLFLLLLLLLLPLILLPWLILPASKITISLSQTWTRPEWKKRR